MELTPIPMEQTSKIFVSSELILVGSLCPTKAPTTPPMATDRALMIIPTGIHRAQQVYGEKYNPLLMFDSKKAVSRMLHEDMERQAVRRLVRQAQKEQQAFQKKRSEQERYHTVPALENIVG